MNILIVAHHYAVCSARYAADAFTRLGHDVRHVGPPRGRQIWGLTLPSECVWEPQNKQWACESSINEHSNWQEDLIIVMDSDPAVLDAQKPNPQYEGTQIVWGVDNHVRDYRREWFDHYFLAHRHVSAMGWTVGPDEVTFYQEDTGTAIIQRQPELLPDMTHLPCAYDPVHFTPSTIPYADREYDVACLGVMYPARRAAVKALEAAGLKVLWGSGLVYESYAQAYHNARISLCLSVAGDMAQRIFETAALGCVVVTDNCPDFQILKPNGFWLLDGTEPETIVKAVQKVLSDPDAAQAQITNSVAWVKPHTWDNRARQIVDWYEACKCDQKNEWSDWDLDD